MIDILLNYSISIVGVLTLLFLLWSHANAESKKQEMNITDYLFHLGKKSQPTREDLLHKLVAIFIVSFIVSLCVFQEFWTEDAFIPVLLATFLLKPMYKTSKHFLG